MCGTNNGLAARVSRNCVLVNLVMSALKLVAGILANSSAMISDALHSFSDVVSACIVLVGVRLAGQDSDKEHPYGHERMECVAAVILSAILFATGIGVGYAGLMRIIGHGGAEASEPGILAFAVALFSIAVNEVMYRYARWASVRAQSGALMAEAWHHRSDSLASVGSFIGIAGARLGFPALDSAACVIICVFITKAACSIFLDSIGKMIDRACDDETVEQMLETILTHEGVLKVDGIRTRLFGDKICVDVEIGTDARATLQEAHNVAHQVRDAIETRFPKVKHCMVHMNPVCTSAGDNASFL